MEREVSLVCVSSPLDEKRTLSPCSDTSILSVWMKAGERDAGAPWLWQRWLLCGRQSLAWRRLVAAAAIVHLLRAPRLFLLPNSQFLFLLLLLFPSLDFLSVWGNGRKAWEGKCGELGPPDMLGSGRREQQPCNLEHWYVFFLTFRNSVFA